MLVILNASEMATLFRQDPEKKRNGGWQSLLVGMQENCDLKTGKLILTADQLRRIPQYAFDYGNGGWESQLVAVFGRHLGQSLGR